MISQQEINSYRKQGNASGTERSIQRIAPSPVTSQHDCNTIAYHTSSAQKHPRNHVIYHIFCMCPCMDVIPHIDTEIEAGEQEIYHLKLKTKPHSHPKKPTTTTKNNETTHPTK